jgi:3-oxoacyl-(acyl-carrier-protein) synthase
VEGRHPSCARASTARRSNTALSNSFGFGGTNASLVFQRYDA